MSDQRSGLSEGERKIVTTLLETKAVDFEAIGKAIAQFGPTAALQFDGEDVFCGTMRTFVRVYRIWNEGGPLQQFGELNQLRQVASQLRGGAEIKG